MASRYCQKPFEFWILVKSSFNIGKLQIFNGEIGKGMGEFSKAMIECCWEASVLASEFSISR